LDSKFIPNNILVKVDQEFCLIQQATETGIDPEFCKLMSNFSFSNYTHAHTNITHIFYTHTHIHTDSTRTMEYWGFLIISMVQMGIFGRAYHISAISCCRASPLPGSSILTLQRGRTMGVATNHHVLSRPLDINDGSPLAIPRSATFLSVLFCCFVLLVQLYFLFQIIAAFCVIGAKIRAHSSL